MTGFESMPVDPREWQRWLFSEWLGLTYADVRPRDIVVLEGCLCVAYARHDGDARFAIGLRPARRLRDAPRIETDANGSVACAFVRCDGDYFTGREAVSLNRDGRIGFAGWADDSNIKPFLSAFEQWATGWLVPMRDKRARAERGA